MPLSTGSEKVARDCGKWVISFSTRSEDIPGLLHLWNPVCGLCKDERKNKKKLSQMQILEHLRQLYVYDLSQKETDKERSLKMRQKRVRQKEDRENPYF